MNVRMCGVRLKDKLSCVQLRQGLDTEGIVTVLHNRLQWCGHVPRKDENDLSREKADQM